MADELVLKIKSNTKSVTKDLEELNDTLSEQRKFLIELKQDEVKLQRERAKMSAYDRS